MSDYESLKERLRQPQDLGNWHVVGLMHEALARIEALERQLDGERLETAAHIDERMKAEAENKRLAQRLGECDGGFETSTKLIATLEAEIKALRGT